MVENTNKIWNIVYPYKHSELEFELKFSIAFVKKNFKGKFHITVIGDIPDWINQDEITCVPLDNHNINAQRQSKINQKILKASEMYDDFILMNDDQYMFKPLTPEMLMIPRKIKPYRGEVTTFQKQVLNTLKELKAVGKNSEMNMISHCPYYYESSKIKELNSVINLAPLGDISVVFETAYFNYFEMNAEYATGYRAGCWGLTMGDYKNCYIFNHNEKGYYYNPKILKILNKYLLKEFDDSNK